MPALSVSVDGVTIATVCTDGFDVITVRAGGTRVDEDLATLDVSGGSYSEGSESTYLTWVSELPLQQNQLVEVLFLGQAQSSHRGKTIEELFPGHAPSMQTDFKPTAEMFEELRTQSKLHDKFSFRLVTSSGAAFVGETTPDEHGFGFTVVWDSFHPDRARVSLYSYSLDSLESRGPMNNHIEEKIRFGGSVRFELTIKGANYFA